MLLLMLGLVVVLTVGLGALHRAIWGRWSLWPIKWLAERRRLLVVGVGMVVILVPAIQLVPYGRDHVNSAVLGEPGWDSPRTEELARRACFDCHSNETVWPWYSNVAPVSWLLTQHIGGGGGIISTSRSGGLAVVIEGMRRRGRCAVVRCRHGIVCWHIRTRG